MSIEEEVIKITAEEIGRKPNEIKINSRFAEDLGFDSLSQIELVMKFEEKYGLKIEDKDGKILEELKPEENKGEEVLERRRSPGGQIDRVLQRWIAEDSLALGLGIGLMVLV